MKINTEVVTAYQNAVLAQCKSTGNTTWGAKQSTATIEAIADACYLGEKPDGFDAEVGEKPDGTPLRARDWVKELVNASAFLQKLNKLKNTNPCYIPPSGNKRGVSSAMGALAEIGV